MHTLDYEEVKKHIDILNVAYTYGSIPVQVILQAGLYCYCCLC